MTPSAASRHPGLDTLRALAIVGVMFFHLSWLVPQALAQVAHFGWMGVDLFFVLSGYLIGSQLLEAHQRHAGAGLWRFYRRRLFRILPAYLAVLALYFLWPTWREDPNISPLWEFLTFTENLFVHYDLNHAFSHVWSLCIEEQFYLVLPLVVLLMMRRPSARKTITVMLTLVLIGIALRTWAFFHILRPLGADEAGVKYIETIYYPTWTRMDGLLAGVTLALIRIFRPAWWTALTCRSYRLLLAGLTFLSLSLWLFANRFTSQTGAAAWGTFLGFPILSIAFALFVASTLSGRGWIRIPGAKWTATLAYSLYLVHKETAHLAEVYLPSLTATVDWKARTVTVIACFAGAALLHFLIERPFLALRDRLEHKPTRDLEERMRLDPAL